MNRTSLTRHRGLTLVEASVTLALLAGFAGAAAPSFSALLDGRRLEQSAARLAADLQLARSEAIDRGTAVRLSLPAGQSCYIVHTGPADACRCEGGADREAAAVCAPGSAQIRTVRWSAAQRVAVGANVASIAFDPQHGTAAPTGTLQVTSADGRVLQHVVNVMGRVRSCAPAGAVAGVRPC